jgi:hypothetical protein
MLVPNILVDETLEKIALYLKTYLNKAVPEDLKTKGILAVRTTMTADYMNVPLTEYPVLKLYRLSSQYKRDLSLRTSMIALTYSLSYPHLKAVPGLLNFIDYHMMNALINWQFDEECMPYDYKLRMLPQNTEYRLLYNSFTQETTPFLRWMTSIEE